MIETKLQPQEIAEKIAKKELDITKMQWHDDFDIKLALKDITHAKLIEKQEKIIWNNLVEINKDLISML